MFAGPFRWELSRPTIDQIFNILAGVTTPPGGRNNESARKLRVRENQKERGGEATAETDTARLQRRECNAMSCEFWGREGC